MAFMMQTKTAVETNNIEITMAAALRMLLSWKRILVEAGDRNLAIPATSVPSEQVFSIAGQIPHAEVP